MNVVFSCCANWETFVAATKIRNIFCVSDTNFMSAGIAARAGKRGNICVGNNVSSFARALSSVSRSARKFPNHPI